MRFTTIVATAAIYFAATHAIPIPDEPAAPQKSPLISNLAVPAVNLDSIFNGAGGGGGTPGEGAVGKFAVIARRKKRGEQAPPPGPAGGVVNTVTAGTGGVAAPVTAKTDPPMTNVLIAAEALQALSPVPPSDQGGVAPQLTGVQGDASSVAGAIDGLGIATSGGGGKKKPA